jgi:hypothetical protein
VSSSTKLYRAETWPRGGVHGHDTSMARIGHINRADVLESLQISMPFYNREGHQIYTKALVRLSREGWGVKFTPGGALSAPWGGITRQKEMF